MFNRSGHSSTQVRKNYSEFQQKGQRFNEFNDHFEGLKVKVTQFCLTLCDPMEYTLHGILQARVLEWVAFPFSRGSSQPRDLPRSPALQADSLLAEHKGGRNTEVGSLSLLQQTFLTQESNQGLLLCRQILYQLSYQGSPFEDLHVENWATQGKLILFLRPFILFIVKLWYRNTTEHTFMYVCFYHASTIYC